MVAVAAVMAADQGVLLQTVGLSRAFGGLQAVRSIDFRLARGEIRAIIGPNGAGKTTFLNMICGRIPPSSGRVVFRGRDITRLPAHDRVTLGIAYTFQIISIFKNLTVEENVTLAVQRRMMRTAREHFALDARALDARVDAALTQVGLSAARDHIAGTLPYGHQRLVEVAMALTLEPEVLCLDEPTQGLSPDEIAATSALIRDIASGITILLIEHNMKVVLDLSRRVTVMNQGAVIAEGTPAEIEANPDVQRVYLGQ